MRLARPKIIRRGNLTKLRNVFWLNLCKDFRMTAPYLDWTRTLVLCGLLVWLFAPAVVAAENEVVVVSPHWDGIREETSRAFSAWHEKKYGQPVAVRWRDVGGGTSQIIRFLRAEYASNPSSGVDILYGGGVDPFEMLEKDGLLTPYDPPAEILAAIPTQLNGMALMDPKHEWFGAALSGFGIITNERVRKAAGLPEVHAWSDLTDPRLQGWISACDPRASGSALTIYEIILQSYGWGKGWAVLMAMSGNVRNFLASSASSASRSGWEMRPTGWRSIPTATRRRPITARKM